MSKVAIISYFSFDPFGLTPHDIAMFYTYCIAMVIISMLTFGLLCQFSRICYSDKVMNIVCLVTPTLWLYTDPHM